jgi:hypothetical protein
MSLLSLPSLSRSFRLKAEATGFQWIGYSALEAERHLNGPFNGRSAAARYSALIVEVDMGAKTLVIVLVAVALFVTATLAMHGRGHRALAKWMPAIHGGG